MRSSYYSRLDRSEDKRNKRKSILFIFGALILLAAAYFIGIPLFVKLATFTTNLRGNTITVNQDITPPPPPILSDIPPSTNQETIDIHGTSEPGSIITLQDNGNKSDTTTDDQGNFQVTLILSKGENTIFANAKDSSGNVSEKSAVLDIIYSTSAPKLDISSPTDGASFFAPQQSVEVKGSTNTDIRLTINDHVVIVGRDGSFSYQFGLNPGQNTLHAVAIDNSGNKTEKTITINYNQ